MALEYFHYKTTKRPFAALFVDKNKHHGSINAEKNDFERLQECLFAVALLLEFDIIIFFKKFSALA